MSARSRKSDDVRMSIESSSWRAWSAVSTGVLPRLTTCRGPRTKPLDSWAAPDGPSASRHGFALRRGSRCKPVKRPRALFADWCENRGLESIRVQPILVAAYVEELQKTHAALSVKQHLAARRGRLRHQRYHPCDHKCSGPDQVEIEPRVAEKHEANPPMTTQATTPVTARWPIV
jgi:hypothetical protein